MRVRSFGVSSVWVLATTLLSPAASGHPANPCAASAPMPIAFRFGTGAPPVGAPALAPDGGVYVGTAEGYVHALRADGSYRWSYTLSGPVTGTSVVTESGTLLVPTAHRVYALRPDGTLLWLFQSPVRITGDLARDRRGRSYFASEDGRLFALSGRGALVSHVPGKGALSAEPVALASGAVAAARRDGEVLLVVDGRASRFNLGAFVSDVLGCPGARLCAVSAGSLYAFGDSGRSWQIPALRAAGGPGGIGVLTADAELELWSGVRGELRYRVKLPESASAAPTLDALGTAYIPLKNGVLWAVSPLGRERGCEELGHSPLGKPVLDRGEGRLFVTASEGILAAISVK